MSSYSFWEIYRLARDTYSKSVKQFHITPSGPPPTYPFSRPLQLARSLYFPKGLALRYRIRSPPNIVETVRVYKCWNVSLRILKGRTASSSAAKPSWDGDFVKKKVTAALTRHRPKTSFTFDWVKAGRTTYRWQSRKAQCFLLRSSARQKLNKVREPRFYERTESTFYDRWKRYIGWPASTHINTRARQIENWMIHTPSSDKCADFPDGSSCTKELPSNCRCARLTRQNKRAISRT